jgi:hypothetical protein
MSSFQREEDYEDSDDELPDLEGEEEDDEDDEEEDEEDEPETPETLSVPNRIFSFMPLSTIHHFSSKSSARKEGMNSTKRKTMQEL